MMCRVLLLSFCVCMLAASVIPKDTPTDPLSDEKHFKEGEHNDKYDHEAFLGQEESEVFDQLSPEESKERLGKLLPKLDKDEDGFVTQEELKEHIMFMQERYKKNDVQRTWSQVNPADGKLDWKAYREMIYGPEDPDREIEAAYKHMLDKDENRWKVADANEDGALDLEEYTCFMHPEGCEHMKDTVVIETVSDIDKNGDGTIDIDEYIKDMYHPDADEADGVEEPDWVKSEREMFTDYRDKNNDGKLDKDEMREWILPTGFDHSEAEARHLLAIADDDKDGKLTNEEILAHTEAFVGSQATDYGEQLQKHDPSEL